MEEATAGVRPSTLEFKYSASILRPYTSFSDSNEIMEELSLKSYVSNLQDIPEGCESRAPTRIVMSFLNKFTHFKLKSLWTRLDVKPRNAYYYYHPD